MPISTSYKQISFGSMHISLVPPYLTAAKFQALMTSDYLGERVKRGRRGKFERAMAKVRDIEPGKKDAL